VCIGQHGLSITQGLLMVGAYWGTIFLFVNTWLKMIHDIPWYSQRENPLLIHVCVATPWCNHSWSEQVTYIQPIVFKWLWCRLPIEIRNHCNNTQFLKCSVPQFEVLSASLSTTIDYLSYGSNKPKLKVQNWGAEHLKHLNLKHSMPPFEALSTSKLRR
jgi:hypothetical protein